MTILITRHSFEGLAHRAASRHESARQAPEYGRSPNTVGAPFPVARFPRSDRDLTSAGMGCCCPTPIPADHQAGAA
jgi:hypothetical protein